MEKQVLNIKQMQHLKELGLDTSKASMCWLKDLTKELAKGEAIDMSKGWFLDFHEPSFYKYGWLEGIPTFTLQDILDLLPHKILGHFFLTIIKDKKAFYNEILYNISYSNTFGTGKTDMVEFISANLIDAAYEMLCWCIEKGYIKTKDL